MPTPCEHNRKCLQKWLFLVTWRQCSRVICAQSNKESDMSTRTSKATHISVACWHAESMVVGIIGMFFVGIESMLKILGFFPEKTAKQREYKKYAS